MKLARLGGAALTALALASDDALVHHSAEGTTLARTASITIDLDLVDLALFEDGEAIDPSTVDPAWTTAGLSVDGSARFEWSDHYERTTAGRALAFTRTLEQVVVDGRAQRDDDAGPLTVAFGWDAEGGAYLRRVRSGGEVAAADERLAALMRVDADHADLLDEGPPRAGDRYEVELAPDGVAALVLPLVDGQRFARAVAPGSTDLRSTDLRSTTLGPDAEFIGLSVERLAGAFDEATLTLVHEGVRTDPDTGRDIANAKVLVDLTGRVRVRDLVPDHLTAGGTPFIGSTLELTGEGEFAWDLAGHHLHHLRLPLDVALTVSVQSGTPIGDEGAFVMSDVGSAAWEGRLELEHATRRR